MTADWHQLVIPQHIILALMNNWNRGTARKSRHQSAALRPSLRIATLGETALTVTTLVVHLTQQLLRSQGLPPKQLQTVFTALLLSRILHMLSQSGVTISPISKDSELTLSTPAVPNCGCSKGPAPYWSNPSFLIFDIRALWRSVLSARASECQKFTRAHHRDEKPERDLTYHLTCLLIYHGTTTHL